MAYISFTHKSFIVRDSFDFFKTIFSIIKSRNSFVQLLVLAMFFLFFSQEIFGATKTWDRGANTDRWGDGNNWNPNGAPGAGDDVVIDINAAILVNVSPTINSLTINNSAVVSLTSSGGGRTITIDNTGSSVASGSSLTLRGSTGNGTRSMTLTFSGTARTMDIAGDFILTAVGEGTIYNATNSVTTVTGTFSNNGSGGGTAGVITSTSSNLSFSAGGTYIHALNGGTIPTATWNAASNCNITGMTSNVSVGGLTQEFGNFTWNCADQTADISLAGNLTTVNGNLSVISTGSSGSLRLLNGGGPVAVSVGGSYVQTGGILYVCGTLSAATLDLNIAGDFSLSSGTFNMNGQTGTSTVNIGGDFTMSGGTFTETNTGTSDFNFIGSSTQVFSKTGGSIANTINFAVNSGTTLDMGTSILTGSGTFNLAGGAGIITAHAQGLSTTAGTGSIQVTGTKAYNTGANYTYNGTVDQVTGNGLTGANNLTINNTAVATLSANVTVSNNLAISAGTLSTDVNQITGNASGIMSMSAGTTLKLGKSVTPYNEISFPTNFSSANVNLDPASTVVFQSPAYQVIPSLTYGNLTISCYGQTIVAPSVSNLTINGDLTIDTNATFSLGYNLSTMTVAKQLIDNGTLIFTNWPTKTVTVTGNLSGSGVVDMTQSVHTLNLNGQNNSIATLTTDANNSTINYGYTGVGAQQVFASNNYRNLTISGGSAKTLQGSTTVNNILTLTSSILSTSSYFLSIANTSTSAIIGGSSTAYIDGSLKRTLPTSLGSGSTYNYPVGSGAKYLPFSLVNPTTAPTGTPTVQVRAYTGSTGGTVDATLDSISTTEYWMLTPTANVTNTSVSMDRTTAISPHNVIAGSTSLNGPYVPYDGTVGVTGITNSNIITIGSDINRYFVFGMKPGIFSTATALSGFTYKENLGPSTIQSFTVSGYSLTTNLKLEMLRGNYELSTSNAPSFVGSGVLYIPVVNGVVSPTTIYIRLKAGLAEKALITDSVSISSSGYTSKIINCSGSVTTPAKLTTSPATLTMSNYTFGGGPSVAQSFVFSGTLLNGNVTVTPPAGFEIATSAGGAYQSTAFTYTPSSGTLGNTTLWARMKSGLGVGTHTGNIVVASSGAVSKNIECSGTVNLGATLTNSTSFLGAFSYAFGGGPSDAQSFVITGQNLTGNIVVTPPSAYFAISRTRGGTYQTSALTITASGSFSDSIFVKMIGGLNVGSYGPSSITVASNGAVTKSVACSGQVFAVATAAIKTSTSSVSGFGYKYAATNPIGVESGGPSNPQSFVVTGVSLSSDIEVQAPDSFEVSTSVNGSYFNSLTLVRTGSKVTPKTVYVRLKKSLPVGIYSGSINLISGMSTSTTVLCNAGKVYASPLITVTGEGDYCLGSTINLGSSGEDIQNRYWEGPNNYYSILQNPTLTTNATADLSGNYIVTGNVVVGGNLIFNGSFELGNVGFGSAYGYPATPFSTSSLVPEGLYAITPTGSVVHNNFNNVADKNIDGTMQMVVNGNTTAGAVVWSQNVAVLPNADYEFSYWLQTVVNGVDGAPSKLQLYVNGVAAGPVYTANPNSGNWAQYLYNTNANANTMLNLELINQTTSAGGNDFALDSITFRQVLIAKDTVPVAVGSPLPVSVSLVASQNPVNAGAPVTYTATPVNGGTAPTYQWFVNNSPVSAASGSTYTYFPSSGDLIKCVVVSSLSCVTNNPATSNTVTQVVNVVANPNYWYGKISTDWGTAANWTDNRVPAAGEDVEYATMENTDSIAVRDLYVDTVRTIGNLINATTQRLVIPAGKSLSVNNSITTNNNVNTIYIQSSSTLPTGTLIFNNVQNYPVSATVEMYSSASWDLTRPVNQKYNWQFFGIPLRSVVAVPTLTGSYVRRYLETGTSISNHWQQLLDESVLSPFYTYEICQKEPKIYTFKGQLVNSNFNSGQLAKTVGAIYRGQHMFANPYTAGMDIRQIQFGSDMDSTVYMYHTGSFGSWSSAAAGKVGENAGQYVSVPQNKAGTSTIPRQVPSMGSMLIRLKPTVSTSTANCYVNFNYASLVMKNTDLLRAPSTKNDIQSVAVNTRIDVTGNNTHDKMWIFSDDSCSRGFDNGDDGIKILGTALQPQIYAVEADGNYQINAVSDMNNTTIAFQAGEDTEYTLTFNHEFAETKYEKIYLHDLVENTILNITENGSIYKFTATSTPNAVNRFRIITKSIGEESTTQSNVKLFVAEQSIYVQNFSDFDGTVYLYDVTGRLHGTTRISPNGVVFFPAKAYNAYVVKTVLLNETVTQKIVLK